MFYTKMLNENTNICECVCEGIGQGDVIVIRKDGDKYHCTVIYRDDGKGTLCAKAMVTDCIIGVQDGCLTVRSGKGIDVAITKKLQF